MKIKHNREFQSNIIFFNPLWFSVFSGEDHEILLFFIEVMFLKLSWVPENEWNGCLKWVGWYQEETSKTILVFFTLPSNFPLLLWISRTKPDNFTPSFFISNLRIFILIIKIEAMKQGKVQRPHESQAVNEIPLH